MVWNCGYAWIKSTLPLEESGRVLLVLALDWTGQAMHQGDAGRRLGKPGEGNSPASFSRLLRLI